MDTIKSLVENSFESIDDAELLPVLSKFSKNRPIKRGKKNGVITLNSADYKIITQMASEGYNRSSIAQVLRVGEATFNKILSRDTAAMDALDRGYSGDLQLMTNVMRNHALDGNIHHMKAYLHVQHGLIVGEETNKTQGLQINVSMPFPVMSGQVYDSQG